MKSSYTWEQLQDPSFAHKRKRPPPKYSGDKRKERMIAKEEYRLRKEFRFVMENFD